MTHDDIMKLPIENVEEIEWAGGSTIDIWFDLNGIRCFFVAHRGTNNAYSPTVISYGLGKFCPYCNQEESHCLLLNTYKEIIFERLIESNSIRLNWLYRECRFD